MALERSAGATAGNIAARVLFPEVPFSGQIGSFLGGAIGGMFGGSGHNVVRLPSFKINKKLLASRGINIPYSNLSSGAYRILGPKIAQQQAAFKEAKNKLRAEFRSSGFMSELEEFNTAIRGKGLQAPDVGGIKNMWGRAQSQINIFQNAINFLNKGMKPPSERTDQVAGDRGGGRELRLPIPQISGRPFESSATDLNIRGVDVGRAAPFETEAGRTPIGQTQTPGGRFAHRERSLALPTSKKRIPLDYSSLTLS